MKEHILIGDCMKKIDRFLIIVLTVIFFFYASGCSNPKSSNNGINITHDIYQITDGTSEFDKLISDNPIDLLYNEEFYNRDLTTTQAVEIQIKYIDIWKNEMDYAIKELLSILNTTDKDIFDDSQKRWEESLTSCMEVDYSILTNSVDYGIDMGEYFKVLYLSEIRNNYRDRTIHIKYLYYLHEKAESKTGDGSRQSGDGK